MNKKLFLSFLVLAFIFAGCNNGPANKKAESGIKKVANEEIDPNKINKEKIPEIAKNLDDALKIFHEHNFGDGSIDAINIDKFKVELTNEIFILKIEGFKNGKIYTLTINDNAQIIGEKIENDEDNKTLALDFKNIISGAEAMDKALDDQSKGAWIKGYELKIENGKAIYDINIAEGRDVKIDAVSGEITK